MDREQADHLISLFEEYKNDVTNQIRLMHTVFDKMAFTTAKYLSIFDEHLNNLCHHLNEIDDKLDNLDNSLSSIDKNIDRIDDNLSDINRSTNGIDTGICSLVEQLERVADASEKANDD